MKQKLWIFGDSYADRVTNYKQFGKVQDIKNAVKFKQLGASDPVDVDTLDYTSTMVGLPKYLIDTEIMTYEGWSYFLEDDYDVENFAVAGISGDTCFLKLTEQADQVSEFSGDRVEGYPVLKDISVVFALADIINRVPLTGYKTNEQWSFLFNTFSKKEYNNIMKNLDRITKLDTWSKYNKFAQTFIMDHAETDEYQNRIKLFMSALDHYAGFFKRFMVMSVGNCEGQHQGWSAKHKFQNLTYRDDLELETLSKKSKLPNKIYQHIFNYTQRDSKYNRPKHLYPNHLDAKQNGKIYNEIKKWMETGG